jgi:beta-galactosidase
MLINFVFYKSYVQWSLHNPKPDVYNFEGIADVERVIEIAKEEDLYVILRPGPYICAEIDNGGLPYWLETEYPGIQVRVNDPHYKLEVSKWYSVLMKNMTKHMYGNGGNIIMVQVENEYGAFKKCDVEYKNFLRDETEKYTEGKALLFTTDRPFDNELECGQIEGVFVTTDFGIATPEEVETHFKRLREVQKTGPLVNSEFYTGWLTHWQEPNARRSAFELASTLRTMLDAPYNANVNFYMFFGGTNFGFWAGANDWGIGQYMADITSYDYDAPLDETGGATSKYIILQDVIRSFMEIPLITDIQLVTKKGKFNSFNLRQTNSILSTTGRSSLNTSVVKDSAKLLTFEELDQFSGFVLYETELPTFTRDPSILYVNKLRDRAQVYIDGKYYGSLSRENNIYSLPISANYGKTLQLFVENQGRINFQMNFDYKGILGNVSIQQFDQPYYKDLTNWTITGFSFDDYKKIEEFILKDRGTPKTYKNGWLKDGPAIFYGEFNVPSQDAIADTWWDATGWGKGVLFVNGFNLGRYWPLAGPQITMYIPASLLKQESNTFVILEQQKAPQNLTINFTDEPNFSED